MITSSADLPGNLGCGSTGMPRPLSVTVRRLPGSSVTSIRLAWPATASSIALSITSAARWWSARVVGPADVHAGAAADRLEPFEHLDRGRVIAVAGAGLAGFEQVGHVAFAIWRQAAPCQASGGDYPQLLGVDRPRCSSPAVVTTRAARGNSTGTDRTGCSAPPNSRSHSSGRQISKIKTTRSSLLSFQASCSIVSSKMRSLPISHERTSFPTRKPHSGGKMSGRWQTRRVFCMPVWGAIRVPARNNENIR